MSAPGQQPARPPFLTAIETRDAQLQGEVSPGVYVYGSVRPLGRIRAYTSAGLSPFAGRGAPSEFHLLGHVHVEEGKVLRVEGFNGQEGERWAKAARETLAKSDALAEKAVVTPMMPLRGCPHTGIR